MQEQQKEYELAYERIHNKIVEGGCVTPARFTPPNIMR
jgi:hypothetical protein